MRHSIERSPAITKSIKKALEHLSYQTEWCIEPERLSGVIVDRSRQQEIIEHTLKELEAIIRTEKLKLLDRLEKQATIVTSLSGEKAGTIDLTAIEDERNKLKESNQ